MNYVGIDHHRQSTHMTLMDQEGQVLRSARISTLRFEIEKFLEGGEAMEAVIETGRSSCTMVDVLEEMGVLASHHHREEIWFSAPLTAGSFFASLIPSNHREEA
jgi:mannose-6-phosphate isomerase-like protein (cupin superfamily)